RYGFRKSRRTLRRETRHHGGATVVFRCFPFRSLNAFAQPTNSASHERSASTTTAPIHSTIVRSSHPARRSLLSTAALGHGLFCQGLSHRSRRRISFSRGHRRWRLVFL